MSLIPWHTRLQIVANLKFAGLSDPFVEVILGQHNWKTRIKYKTLNPTWTEHHRIPIVNWELPNLLTLRVQDWDFLKRPDELGYVRTSFRGSLRLIELH